MSTWKEPGDIITEDGLVLRSILVVASKNLPKSRSASYKIEAGIYKEGRFDVLGTVDGAETALSDGVKLPIIKKAAVNKPLVNGHQLMVRVTKTGSPANIQGTTVLFEMKRAGEKGVGPLVGGDPEDQSTQQVNRVLGIQYARVNLTEPTDAASSSTETTEVEEDADTGTLTVSTLNTYTAFSPDQSITLTPPDSGETYIAFVWARADQDIASGANAGSMKIRNTTDSTDLDEVTGMGVAAGPSYTVSLFGQEEISQATTYQLQFRRDTGSASNAVWRQPKIMGFLLRKTGVVA